MIRLLLMISALTIAGQAAFAQDKNTDLEKIAIPFLAKHCTSCHGPEKKKADLVLHVYKDEKSLIKDRKKWNNILQMVQAGEMPPEGRPRPKPEEVTAFLKAVQGIYQRHDLAAGPDPGRVTMRRLNRTEYNNTIRDLIGVDFQAAADFPADDVGYGFDNIGDVLSISPVHMERYLSAAEDIMAKAIMVGTLPKPSFRRSQGRYLTHGASKNLKGEYRQVSKGLVQAAFSSTIGGEFKMSIRAYGQQVGKEPVKVAFIINGNEVKTFDVAAVEKKPATYDAVVKLPKGALVCQVKILNEYKDPADATKERALFLDSIQIVGPTDPRPESHHLLLDCDPKLDAKEKTRFLLKRFADRAYRRPSTSAEVDRLIPFVESVEKNGGQWEAGMALAMQAVLVSPKFLFRVELDSRPVSKDPLPLDDYQLASRLSYFIWNSMPDDELFALAAKKTLHAQIEPQVRRMLKDPKAKSFVDGFFTQWLQLQPLNTASPDSKVFAEFNEKLRADMLTETGLFFNHIVEEDRSILEMIDSNYSFVNERLGLHYGIGDTNGHPAFFKPKKGETLKVPVGEKLKGDKFVKVKFQEAERGGILTQASVLTVTSNPTRTSPVKRGKWVLEQILGTPPPPPPPNVPELEGTKQTSGTLRQRMEQHRKNPACASCHTTMDAIGFGLENFNGVGKFRKKDGDADIDSSGTLPNGQTFKGPQELRQILLSKKELFCRCLAEKMLTYATGRGVETYDRPSIDRIVDALPTHQYRFSSLVIEIAKSDPFRLRRGKEKP